MTRVTIMELDEAGPSRRLFGLVAADLIGVALVAALATMLSVVSSGLISGWGSKEMWPSVIIPLVISIPISAFVFRQRRAMADMNRQMLDLLRFDPLTGLMSRRFFLAAAEAESQRGGAVILIDADRFKAINDRFGHPVGDTVLAALAQRFRAVAQDEVLLGRLGGEEFAVFAPGHTMDTGQALAEAMRNNVRAAGIATDKGEITCSVSLGLAMLTPGDPLARAITAADEALYRAKLRGRDRVCVAGQIPPHGPDATMAQAMPG